MRIRRCATVVPFAVLLAGCSIDPVERGAQDGLFSANDEQAKLLAGEIGLKEVAATRPEVLRGAGKLSVKRVHIDDLGEAHDRLAQDIDGIPVFGAEAILHLNRRGQLIDVTDRIERDLRVDTKPSLSREEAIDIAVQQAGGATMLVGAPRAELQIYSERNGARLTYMVELEARTLEDDLSMPVVFVDAITSQIVASFDNLETARNRKTYTAKNLSTLPGTLVLSEGQAPSADAVLNQAHDNAGLTYDFYFSKYGRDSYNGAGAILSSTVHYNANYVNAFWNGSQMVYGDGDGSQSGPLTVLDIVAHELTHAVTSTSSALVYQNESGALNEAMSDIFGAAIEAQRDGAVSGNTWKIGEECWTPATAGDALRYMNDPALAGDYDHYASRYTGTSDNGGVHWNSGIANLAYYLMVAGGTHPRGKSSNVVPTLATNSLDSILKGAAIFYRANTVYLTANSTFADARTATVQAATDLYGAAEITAVSEAWTAVGVAAAPLWVTFAQQSNLSGARNNKKNFSYATPVGAQAIKFEMSDGSGDADLYVKWGSAPTTSSYDCRPYKAGNIEACSFNPAKQGTYYVMINGYQAYSGVTLKASSAP